MRIGLYCAWSVKIASNGFYISSIHKKYLDVFRLNFPSSPITLVSNISNAKPTPDEEFVSNENIRLLPLPAFTTYLQSLRYFPKILTALTKLSKECDYIYIKTFEPFAWILALTKSSTTVLNYHFVINPYEAIWGKELDSTLKKVIKSVLFFPEYHLICLSAFANKATGNGPSILRNIPFYLQSKIQILIESSLKECDYLNEEKKTHHNKLRILTVAALKSAKGYSYLFEAIELFRNKYPNEAIELNVVGDGEDKEIIFNAVKEKKLESLVNFHGHLNGEELLKAFKESDIFVLASLAETGPRVVLEAMAMKLFVICSDVGYARSVLTDSNTENGILTRLRRSDDILNALEWYKNNRDEAEKMTQQAFESSKKFSLSSFIKLVTSKNERTTN
jgi:glycosyltransferase involved in cell wall biosynthesis